MKCSHLLSLSVVIGLFATSAFADPPETPSVACNAGGLAAHPKFTQVSPGRAEYNFSGVCTTREGRFLGYRLVSTWTPSESDPANANASEIYRIDTLSGPSQSYEAILGAHCTADPWLNNAACARVGDNISDELRELWPELADDLFPYSRRHIPDDQRAALRSEYDRANGRVDRSQVLTDGVRSGGANRYGSALQSATHGADTLRTAGDAVALNPQPLPPGPPDPDRAAQPTVPVASDGSDAAIIIVGGKTPYRRASKTKVRATDAVSRP